MKNLLNHERKLLKYFYY